MAAMPQTPLNLPTHDLALQEGDLDFRELLRVVLKHARLIVAITGTVMLLAGLYAFLWPKTWQAKVTVKIPDPKAGNPLKELALMGSGTDPIETYLEVARSYNVASRAAEKAALIAQPEYAEAADVPAAFQRKVNVSTVKLSNIIVFQAKAMDPALAVRAADALAEAFIEVNLDFSRTGARSRRQFIETQLTEVKERLVQGEEVLQRLIERQRRATTRPDQAGARSEMDPIINLQTQLMNLRIEKANLASRYNSDHPQMKEVNARIGEAQNQLNQELSRLPKDQLDFTRLNREVKVDEAVYNLLLEKYQEARLAENVDDSGIVVVDAAQLPQLPLSPKKNRILALSLILGALAGFGLAWVLERWRDQVGGEDELARLSRLPTLAMVPDYRDEGLEAKDLKTPKVAPRHDPANLILNPIYKHTYYSEAFKVLRTNLAFSQVDRQLKVLSVLSAGGEEGKTLTNANMALALAATGKKVLLVDADLRKPSVHKVFGVGIKKDLGLPLLLSGQSSLEQLLVQGPLPNLWLLPCGTLPPNPAELLGSQALDGALAQMKAQFDHIIFDSPPILPVTDGVVLSTRMDGVILLARFEQTRRDEIRRALDHLAAVRAPVLGCVLNAVDMKKYAYAYGYGRRYYAYGGGQGHS